jgi:hypothetical protein
MRGRLIWLLFGVVFSVTLALIVGQRLSAESMAVVIGVIAGVAASIPTSLIVVWFMGHNTVARPIVEAAPASARSPEPPEPRIVVMPAPQAPAQPQPAYAGMAGYGPQSYAGYAPAPGGYAPAANQAYAPAPALPARRFTVIGGSDSMVEEPAYLEESVTWQR